MGVRVLIIGFGYLGKTLGHQLMADGHQVWGIKRHHRASVDQDFDRNIEVIWQDFHTLSIQHIPKVDYVVFCPSPDGSTVEHYQHTFLKGSQKALALCRAMDTNPMLIFVSSTSVFQQNKGQWVDETTPCEPDNPKAQVLLQSEQQLMASGHPVTIVRPSGLYGHGRCHLLDALMQHRAHICHSTRYSNRIHVVDCARAIYHIMRLNINDGLYLLTDSEPTPINSIIGWLSSLTGLPIPQDRHEHSADQGDFRLNKRLSNARLLESGFSLEYPSFKQGFKELLIARGLLDHDFNQS
ncbi:MAG: NAD-dependent epimerase/dehydratase family protein [Pseudomonadota bacterium]|nr:NAD-dependent epimerase/dehydratase family protein [Pseudomonadota bacterium]